MSLNFDPETGLSASTTEETRAAIVSDWQAVFDDEDYTLNTEPESPAGQIIDSTAALVTAKDTELLNILNQFNPLTASGRCQDAIAKIYFLTRKIAESTVVTCQCIGLRGTVIPANAIIQTTDGIRLYSLGAVTIPASGTANVLFAAQETGPIEIGANTCTTIITVIAGWDKVNNAAAGVLGRDIETRAEFEARRYASVAKNSHGSVASVYGAIADISGVLDLAVLENRSDVSEVQHGVTIPGHSVAVCVYGGADAAIAYALYTKLGNGCGTTGNTDVSYTEPTTEALYKYKILRPTPTAVKITVQVRFALGMYNDIVNAVKKAVYSDFYGRNEESGNTRVGLAQTVYASRFSVACIKTAGVKNLIGITIGLGSGSMGDYIEIPANVEPTLSEADITVEVWPDD